MIIVQNSKCYSRNDVTIESDVMPKKRKFVENPPPPLPQQLTTLFCSLSPTNCIAKASKIL